MREEKAAWESTIYGKGKIEMREEKAACESTIYGKGKYK
jgi:hypothetical protein